MSHKDLSLSSFNSVFEIAVGFGFAYTTIEAFRNKIKAKVYDAVRNTLKAHRSSLSNILATQNLMHWLRELVTIFLIDLESRITKEFDNTNAAKEHRIKECLLYFSFFALICILAAGLLDAYSDDVYGYEVRFRVYLFLAIFSLISFIIVESRYQIIPNPSFEWTLGLFIGSFFTSYSLAIYLDIVPLMSVSGAYLGGLHIYEMHEASRFYNYVTAATVAINIYPYFLFFRKFYVLSAAYLIISYSLVTLNRGLIIVSGVTFTTNLTIELIEQKFRIPLRLWMTKIKYPFLPIGAAIDSFLDRLREKLGIE